MSRRSDGLHMGGQHSKSVFRPSESNSTPCTLLLVPEST